MDKIQSNIDEEIVIEQALHIDQCSDILMQACNNSDYSAVDLIASQYPREIIEEALDNATQAICHQIYTTAHDILSDQINPTLENRALEIFVVLFSPPLDPQFNDLRAQIKPIYDKLRFIREQSVVFHAHDAEKKLEKFIANFINQNTTYAEIKAKHDLAAGMLLALSIETTTQNEIAKLYQDAIDIFGIVPIETDKATIQYHARLINALQSIENMTSIIVNMQKITKKADDDYINIENMRKVAQLLIPEMLSENDFILPYIIFPDELPTDIAGTVATKQDEQQTKSISIDIG